MYKGMELIFCIAFIRSVSYAKEITQHATLQVCLLRVDCHTNEGENSG